MLPALWIYLITTRQFTEPVVNIFIEQAHQTAKQYPGIENRKFTLGQFWDYLCYLLSADRRVENSHLYKFDRQNIFEQAILGCEVLSFNQNVYYLSSEKVKIASRELAAVEKEALFAHFNIIRMKEADVYCIGRFEVSDIERLWDTFQKFRDFYQQIASNDEGLVIQLM